jgi:hypothetical protein
VKELDSHRAFKGGSFITELITLVIYVIGNWKKKQIMTKTAILTSQVEDELMTDGMEVSK